jgi:formylmethanofuran dehydrogenase subunit E
MSCTFSQEVLDKVVEFHGHRCPGLSIGIRAAEYALQEFDKDAELVAVSETDMCGVDAIQFLTGCTYGKGNFLHRDYGKMAFSFFDRKSGRAVRLVLKPESRQGMDANLQKLMVAMQNGTATEEDKKQATQVRGSLEQRFMTLPLEELFTITPLDVQPPRGARVLQSLPCDICGEMTMESRTRRFAGKTLCIPCFGTVEQKI